MDAAYVSVGDEHLHIGIDLHVAHEYFLLLQVFFENVFELAFLQLGDRFLKDFLVSFVADVGDEAALLAAQQVARPANVEVFHGDVEAATQVAELFDGAHALARFGGERAQRRAEEVAVGFLVAAPDASPQLVQIAHAELVRVVDDHRIGIGDIQSGFDDVGADEHVVFLIDKAQQYPFQLFTVHLPVGAGHIHIGAEAAHHGGDVAEAFHAIVHEENLPTAIDLVVDRLLDELVVEDPNLGMNRLPVGRRGTDDTQVAGRHEAELERTRDRGGRQREGIHVHLHGA